MPARNRPRTHNPSRAGLAPHAEKLATCLEDWKGFVTRRRSQQVSIRTGRGSDRRSLRMDLLRHTSPAGGNGRLLNLVLGALFITAVQNGMNLIKRTLASLRSALRPARFLHDAVPVPAWRRGRLQGSG